MKEAYLYSDTELIETIKKRMESENVSEGFRKMIDELIRRFVTIAEGEGGLT